MEDDKELQSNQEQVDIKIAIHYKKVGDNNEKGSYCVIIRSHSADTNFKPNVSLMHEWIDKVFIGDVTRMNKKEFWMNSTEMMSSKEEVFI